MSGLEVPLIIGAAAVGAAGLAGAAAEFVGRQREWWRADNRPAEHPMACDSRCSLGLMHDLRYTKKDIDKHFRQATRWWHPDRNHGVDHGFKDFERIRKAFLLPRMLERYGEAVKKEQELMSRISQDMNWRSFNERFFSDSEAKPRSMPPPSAPYEPEFCHVFLDSSGSMKGSSKSDPTKQRLEVGKEVIRDLFPRFVDSPTTVHLIGDKSGSRCLIPHSQDISYSDEAWLLDKWTADEGATYLWHYIYEQIKDFRDSKHDVIIITDGNDNESEGGFAGLSGFNGLMSHMRGGRVRISLHLLGESVSEDDAFTYRDVCIATGGFYSSETDGEHSAIENFVFPLLLPEGERDVLAVQQQRTYMAMLENGKAQRFDWYLSIADSHSNSTDAGAQGSQRFSPPSRGSASAMPPRQLAPRVKVRVHGLQNAIDLNGCIGVCERWLPESSRWEVKLDNGDVKAFRDTNLVSCRS